MGLLLALDRFIPDNVRLLREGQWEKKRFGKGRGLHGRTLGVIGTGRIGQEVVTRAQAFGMQCVAWSRSLDEERAQALGVKRCDSPREVCAAADALCVHVALTEETRHLIGAKEPRGDPRRGRRHPRSAGRCHRRRGAGSRDRVRTTARRLDVTKTSPKGGRGPTRDDSATSMGSTAPTTSALD